MAKSKYAWAGNKIKEEDMKFLYNRKEKYGVRITTQIAEAVKEYVVKKKGDEGNGEKGKQTKS